MRIALLTNFIPPYRVPLYTALSRPGQVLRVLISTPMEPNRHWDVTWKNLDVIIQRSLMVRQRWRHPGGFEESMYVHLPYDTLSQLRSYKPDVVISGELGLRSVLAVLYCRRYQVPLVLWATLSEHTEQGRGRLREYVRRWLLQQADAVLVNGASGARYVQRYGVSNAQIFKAPYTPDASRLLDVSLDRPFRTTRRLLVVGQFVARKGVLPFLEALAAWATRHPEQLLELTLVGEGPLQPQIEAFPLPPSVTMHLRGHVPYDHMPALYQQADFLVFPTLADEWGLVVNEALMAGVPVLGSRYSQAVEELIEEDINGWSFHPHAPEEMLDVLDTALSVPATSLAAMRGAARRSVQAFTPERVADTILRAVRFACDARRSIRSSTGPSHAHSACP